MTVFEKNLAALRTRDVALAEAIERAGACAAGIEVVAGKRGNAYLSMHGRTICSRIDPRTEAEELIAALVLPKYPTLIVYGFALGYHVRAAWSRLSALNRLFIIEPDTALFAEALRHNDFSEILSHRRAVFLVGMAAEEIYAHFVDNFFDFVASEFAFTGWDAYVRERDDYFHGLTERIKDAIRTCRCNLATIHSGGSTMMRNVIANLPYIWASPGVCELFGRFSDVPGIIVSAGPSLDKNVHLLSQLKGKALICATDTAYKILCKRGIVPDLVFTIDFNGISEKHFQDVTQLGVPLVFDMEAAPTTLAAHQGPTMTGRGEKPLSAWAERVCGEKGYLPTGLSVAHYIFNALVAFGCERIVFVGQDLAFPGGKTHAEGTHSQLAVHAGDTQSDGKQLRTVVSDLTGEEMVTRDDMYVYKCFFEKMVAATAVECVNATEGGAGIKGTKAMKLAEVVELYVDRKPTVEERLARAFADYIPTPVAQRDAAIAEFRALLGKTRAAAKEIASAIEAVLKRTEIYGLDRANAAREFGRIEKATSFIEKQEFLLGLLHAKLLKNIFQMRREGAVDAEDIAKKSDRAYLDSLREDLDFQTTLIAATEELDGYFETLCFCRQTP